MKKVLVVADERGWAFDKIYHGLKKNISNYEIEVLYLNDYNENYHHINDILCDFNTNKLNIMLYLCDNYPVPLIGWINRGLSKEKVILAIRSEVDHVLYDEKNKGILNDACEILAVSNERLFDRFKTIHSNVKIASGGVDTDIFTYKERKKPKNIIVGWSGSVGVFDRDFRGLDIIQQACDELGYTFNPALRQDKHRNESEMVDYYHNEINVYVEMSKFAGRQNGLIEAGATGVPVISYNCGIADSLLKHNACGRLLPKRDVDCLKQALTALVGNYDIYSNNIQNGVRALWSWKAQSKYFEDIFDTIKI